MLCVLLTLKEINAAAAWATKHANEKHGGVIAVADLAVRTLEGSGIGQRTVVTCEACDRVKVTNENYGDVTDYDAW